MKLRPYQQAAVDGTRAAMAALIAAAPKVAPAVCLVAPTGAGKTVVFAAVCASAVAKGKRVLILAHRRELVRQAGEKLAAAGVAFAVLAPGHAYDPDCLVQVASVQFLASVLKKDPSDPRATGYDLVIPDECHHAVSHGYRAIFDANRRGAVLGVTATPERLDGRGLGRRASGPFAALVLGPTVAQLQDAGHLCRARVYAPPGGGPDLRGVRRVAGDYGAGQLAEVMGKPQLVGDAVEHYRRHADGLPALAFCASVAHAKAVAEAFRAAGYRAAAADGSMRAADRDAAIGGLSNGSVQVLACCDLVSEGLDVPGVACVVLLRPTASLCLHVQQVGRGLRPAPGKPFLVVLDHAGNTGRHGLPDEAHTWSLEGRTVRNRTAPAVSQCPSCYALHRPGPVCPACDFAYPKTVAGRSRVLRQVGGDLVETRPREERAAAAAAKIAAEDEARADRIEAIRGLSYEQMMARARSHRDFADIAAARGYRPGWAHYKYTEFANRIPSPGARPPVTPERNNGTGRPA